MSDEDERDLNRRSTENGEHVEDDLELEEQAASEVKGGMVGGPTKSGSPLVKPTKVASTLTGGIDEPSSPE